MQFDIWREIGWECFDAAWKCFLMTFFASLFCFYFISTRLKERRAPPACKGWIPWLGCALSFGKGPLDFIGAKGKELGSVFTLHIAGERMTFLMDPVDYHHFFDSDKIDFQQAICDAACKAASFDKTTLFRYHTNLHDAVKGRLAPNNLVSVLQELCNKFNINIQKHVQLAKKQDLMDAVQRSMYRSFISTLFGDVLGDTTQELDTFLHHFKTFDDQFEIAAKLPEMFVPKWSKAKRFLLDKFKVAFSTSGSNNQSLFAALLTKTDKTYVPNFAMLVNFASLANAVPVTFWTLAYVLENDAIKQKLIEQLKAAFLNKNNEAKVSITHDDICKVPYLKWCVLEATRLRSEGVLARRVVKDFEIKNFIISKGTLLMLSPYWSHRNETYFVNPELYCPERWENVNTDTLTYKNGFIAFGGGRYKCPGRWFAVDAMQMFVAMFLLKYDITVHTPFPKINMQHIVGVQHPDVPYQVTCIEHDSSSVQQNQLYGSTELKS